jgi:hypothetical protein
MSLSISPARRLNIAKVPYLYDVAYYYFGVQLSIDLEK